VIIRPAGVSPHACLFLPCTMRARTTERDPPHSA
jgi:hypothetical protein